MTNDYRICDQCAVVLVKCKGRALECLIDVADLPLVKALPYTLIANEERRKTLPAVYVVTFSMKTPTRECTTVRLSHVIMRPSKGLFVDHINHDPLDNRRSNLRVVTNSENMQNLQPNTYSNVRWDKRKKRWYVRMAINNKATYFGTSYKTQDEALDVARRVRASLLPFSQEALSTQME
jgi:hypothetical protein